MLRSSLCMFLAATVSVAMAGPTDMAMEAASKTFLNDTGENVYGLRLLLPLGTSAVSHFDGSLGTHIKFQTFTQFSSGSESFFQWTDPIDGSSNPYIQPLENFTVGYLDNPWRSPIYDMEFLDQTNSVLEYTDQLTIYTVKTNYVAAAPLYTQVGFNDGALPCTTCDTSGSVNGIGYFVSDTYIPLDQLNDANGSLVSSLIQYQNFSPFTLDAGQTQMVGLPVNVGQGQHLILQYDVYQGTHFQVHDYAEFAAVPEPDSMAVCLVGGLMLLKRKRSNVVG